MKKIYSFILTALLAVILVSCNKWMDINVDPDTPSNATATCATRLPWIQHSYGYAYGNASTTVSGITGQQVTMNNYRDYQNYNVYTYTAGIVNPYQMFFVNGGANIQDLIDRATAENAYHYIGAAKVLKAMGFVMMVDLYGEMPFTEALSSALTPAYDDGKTIYDGCIALLDEALEEFAKSQPATATPLSAGDNWNGGNVQKWIKLCHGLKARWLNNQSKLSSYNPDAVLAEVAQGPTNNSESTVIRHFNSASDTDADPLIGDPVLTSFIFNVAAWGYHFRNSQYMIDLLTNKYTSSLGYVKDPRYHKLLSHTMRWKDTNADGVNDTQYWDNDPQGVDIINSDFMMNATTVPNLCSFNTSKDDIIIKYTIADATERANFISSVDGNHVYEVEGNDVKVHYKYRTWYNSSTDYRRAGDTIYSTIRAFHRAISSGFDGYSSRFVTDANGIKTFENSGTFYSRPEAPTDVLTYHEMCFIKAEALLRKGDAGGALTAYQQGIKAHIDHMQAILIEQEGGKDFDVNPHYGRMDAAEIAAFYASDVYTGPISMKKIMCQKFIAMNFTLQNWVDMRRFNYSAGNIGSFGVVYEGFDRPYITKYNTNLAACFPGATKTANNYWFRRFMQCSHEIRYNKTQLLAIQPKAQDPDIWSTPVFWDVD